MAASSLSSSLLIGLSTSFLGAFCFFHFFQKNKASTKQLKDFQCTEQLSVEYYRIALLGVFQGKESEKAIVIIEQSKFYKGSVQSYLSSLSLTRTHHNDIYSSYKASMDADEGLKVTVICPATKEHILKYSKQKLHMVHETPEMYRNTMLPMIENLPQAKVQWVYNILQHEAEEERILYENSDPTNGFILLPDTKWHDLTSPEALYCLALCHRRDIRCLRDLTGKDLELLRRLRAESLAFIKTKFGLRNDEIVVLVHYPPTYYHFHVHFIHLKAFENGYNVTGALYLDTIISNLEMDGQYYQKSTISYFLGEQRHKDIYKKMIEKNYLQ